MFERKPGDSTESPPVTVEPSPPQSTMLDEVAARIGPAALQRRLVQRRARRAEAAEPAEVQRAAAEGLAGAGGQLPHLDAIQRSFGRYDVSGVQAHTDENAAQANRAMGAEGYATG